MLLFPSITNRECSVPSAKATADITARETFEGIFSTGLRELASRYNGEAH
jgi:hypothetical protein